MAKLTAVRNRGTSSYCLGLQQNQSITAVKYTCPARFPDRNLKIIVPIAQDFKSPQNNRGETSFLP